MPGRAITPLTVGHFRFLESGPHGTVHTSIIVICKAPKRNPNRSADKDDVARSCGAHLTYPIHSLNDFFSFMQSHLKKDAHGEGKTPEAEAEAIRETAWACVEHLRTFATAIAADESDAWRACKYRALTNDLEDNFVLAAAERVPVDFMVANDQRLLRKATVNAYSHVDAALMLLATR